MARLPTPGGDTNNWGNILNTYLGVSLAADGTILPGAVQGLSSLTPTSIKTANYTAAAFDFVICDTTSGSFTVTLPTAPSNTTRIAVRMIKQGGSNTVTVQTGGTDVIDFSGGSTSVVMQFVSETLQLQYASGIWYILYDQSPALHSSTAESITGNKTFTADPIWGTQSYSGGTTLVDGSAPLVLTNTTSGAFVVNLPPSPRTGTWYIFADVSNTWNSHNLTIGRNGKNIDGQGSNLVLTSGGAAVKLIYDGSQWHSQNYTNAGGDLQGNYPNPTLRSSITLLGTPLLANTPAQDNNSAEIADTAWFMGQKGTVAPLANGTANAGSSSRWAPIDHTHPTSLSTGVTGFVDAFSFVQGVTPGLSGNPQTALQVTASGTWVLSIAAGSALVQGTDANPQPMYALTQGSGTTLTLGTHAPATNPRIDAIIVQFNDAGYTARTPANSYSYQQIVGTPTSGANLTNLSGAPSIPASSLLLAYILVNTTDAGVVNGNVSDQRILAGPGIWGEDGHRYRLGIDTTGNLYVGQVI